MKFVTNNIDLTTGNAETKRAEIKKYYNDTWSIYEHLFETLISDDVFYERPQPLRHPLVFYFGHTATFFINKLILSKQLTKRINPRFESLFAIGVDEMSWDDLNDTHYAWPAIEEIRQYRDLVNSTINKLIDQTDFTLPIDWDSPMWTIMMGIEHERIHLETSSVLIRQLPLDKVKSTPLFPVCTEMGNAPANELIQVAKGTIHLGKNFDHYLYGWDNEYGTADIEVPEFYASKYLVSNEEYLEFMNAGGYTEERFWSEEGLAWLNYHKADKPEFWRGESRSYRLRLMTEEIALPMNWPVEVCYLEAKAFCNWKSEVSGKTVRMPDESEYRRLLEDAGLDHEHHEKPISANWNLEHWASSSPIDTFAHGRFYDLVGNVWQWNETPIYPFDGFKVHPFYDDFTVPTYDNRHNLIKGGSWISTGNEIMLNSRYAFRRHFYQHSGFRYVVSDKAVKTTFDIYETDRILCQHCEFHYGDENFNVPNFSKTISQLALQAMKASHNGKALDMGCSVGRTAFELADHFKSIDALDFSARFIQIAANMQTNGRIRYERTEEGDLVSFQERTLQELGLSGDYSNISFLQQDAMNIKPIFKGYDLIVASNLIELLPDPSYFLRDIASRINSGGTLLIASTYTWQEEFTPKDKWLGGFKCDGEPVTTLDGLKELLSKDFVLVDTKQMPFVIRKTQNNYQHNISEITIWTKK